MIKNGKLFGKINLIDAGVILLIMVLLVAGTLKFKTFNKKIEASAVGTITYTVIINNVRDYTAGAFVSGDTVFDSGTNVNIGTIRNVEAKTALIAKNLADGTVKMIENPYKKDVILTIEVPGTASDTGYFANRSIELKIGSEKNIETRYATTLGKIGSIEYNEGV